MARKSNQKKKGVDFQASNVSKRSSDSVVAEADLKGQPKGKEMNGVNGTEKPRSLDTDWGESNGNSNTEIPSGVRENGSGPYFDKSRIRTRSHRQSKASSLMNRVNIRSALESIELPDNAFTRRLKESASSAVKASSEWVEKQRQGPLFNAVRTKADVACGYLGAKFQSVYPVVLKWLMSIGSVVLLVSMMWLDSIVRGGHSFLRLGTTSFFSVIWFSFLSVVAMAGIYKFLVVFAIAALIGVFVGFSLGILILGFSGIVFLWLYGSFWTTTIVIFLGGLAYSSRHERVAMLITTTYSVYCAWIYVGWLGLVLGFNVAFISSDVLVYFLKNSVNQRRTNGTPGPQGFNAEHVHGKSSSESSPGFSADRGPGTTSTSGTDFELTSEDEIVRLLNCGDHYSVLGLTRFETVDVSLLKKEYKKKAMLVHPDKNMGNEKAAEAFKKLQNAYEVLLDSTKQKAYDDELRKDELLNIFRRFQNTSQTTGFGSGTARSGVDGEDPLGDSRRISCKKCNGFHVWISTRKSKSQARFCQECKEFHPAKDGDGWVEQSSQPFLFGMMQKVDTPVAYVCADSKIYNASEWFICQGMRCPANTHKPSFHVNTSIASKGPSSGGQKGTRMPNVEEVMTEDEFFEWLQSAMQSGAFENGAESPSPKTASANKRKKKGKKQW